MTDLQQERRRASARVETQMLNWLMRWTPAHELKIGDACEIALWARNFAFDEFSPDRMGKEP